MVKRNSLCDLTVRFVASNIFILMMEPKIKKNQKTRSTPLFYPLNQ
jgi:hypothetical protein